MFEYLYSSSTIKISNNLNINRCMRTLGSHGRDILERMIEIRYFSFGIFNSLISLSLCFSVSFLCLLKSDAELYFNII